MFRGYDDSFMWSHSGYLNYYFVPAIKKFCYKKLQETTDKRFIKVYSEMLEIINAWEAEENNDWYKYPNKTSKMWEYYGNNIHFFWD